MNELDLPLDGDHVGFVDDGEVVVAETLDEPEPGVYYWLFNDRIVKVRGGVEYVEDLPDWDAYHPFQFNADDATPLRVIS